MVFSKNREDKWTPSDLTMIRHNFAISNALCNNSAIVMDQKNSLVYYSLILTLLEKLRDVVCYIFAKKNWLKNLKFGIMIFMFVQVVKYYYFYIGQHYVNFIVYSLSQKSMYYVHVSQVTGKKTTRFVQNRSLLQKVCTYINIYIFSAI